MMPGNGGDGHGRHKQNVDPTWTRCGVFRAVNANLSGQCAREVKVGKDAGGETSVVACARVVCDNRRSTVRRGGCPHQVGYCLEEARTKFGPSSLRAQSRGHFRCRNKWTRPQFDGRATLRVSLAQPDLIGDPSPTGTDLDPRIATHCVLRHDISEDGFASTVLDEAALVTL